MLGLLIGLIVGFVLGDHNAKLRFFYVGKHKKGEPTTQDVIVGWKK